MDFNWKGNTALILTGLISAIGWILFVFFSADLERTVIAFLFLVVAIISLLRFGQLLDRKLKGAIQ